MSNEDVALTCLVIRNQMQTITDRYNLISYALETLPPEIREPAREKLNRFADAGPEFFTELINQKEKYVLSTETRQGDGIGRSAAA